MNQGFLRIVLVVFGVTSLTGCGQSAAEETATTSGAAFDAHGSVRVDSNGVRLVGNTSTGDKTEIKVDENGVDVNAQLSPQTTEALRKSGANVNITINGKRMTGNNFHFPAGNEGFVQGSGRVSSENRSVPAFSRIDDSTSAEVNVTIGNENKLSIQAEDNILPLIKTQVDGDTLRIGSEAAFTTNKPIRIEITTPKLDGVSLSGSGKFAAKNIDTGAFKIDVSGSPAVSLSGKATKISADLSGSGNLDARELAADSAKVDISGSASASVNARNKLHADVSGSGTVRYLGQPQTETDISGSGRVAPL